MPNDERGFCGSKSSCLLRRWLHLPIHEVELLVNRARSNSRKAKLRSDAGRKPSARGAHDVAEVAAAHGGIRKKGVHDKKVATIARLCSEEEKCLVASVIDLWENYGTPNGR